MFFISIICALLCLICSTFISINWISDISNYFGYFLAFFLVTFIALIPGFNYIFALISLLFNKENKTYNTQKEPDLTVLIPLYNSKDSILETIDSIQKQEYTGNIFINVIDDGSTDDSLEILKKAVKYNSKILII